MQGAKCCIHMQCSLLQDVYLAWHMAVVVLQTVRYCSEVPADEAIPATAVDSDGEVDVKYVFCATCKGRHCSDDDDLVLCDGPCNR